MTRPTNRGFGAMMPIDPRTVAAHLDQLIDHAFAKRLTIHRIAELMRGDPRDYARLGNLPPVVEGELLEQAITVLASANPDVAVFVDCRLPFDPDFVERIRTMPIELIGKIGAAAGRHSRHNYRPDLLLINGETGTAHLVDIKRSLNSYDAIRITHLRHRMLAAAISPPELLGQAGSKLALRDNRGIRSGRDAHITVHNSKGGRHHMGDISYVYDAHAEPGTSNGSIQVDADDYNMFLSMNAFSRNEDAKYDAKQAAEALWVEFTGHAGIEYE